MSVIWWHGTDLGGFWTGDMEEYFKLYRHTAEAIKRIDNGLCIGRPATTRGAWLPEISDFCKRNGTA